jgi:hypothetical protein
MHNLAPSRSKGLNTLKISSLERLLTRQHTMKKPHAPSSDKMPSRCPAQFVTNEAQGDVTCYESERDLSISWVCYPSP